jgi:translation initiation factor IF-2
MTPRFAPPPDAARSGKLELVLKCDVAGTEEAVRATLAAIGPAAGVEVRVVHAGLGPVSKSDVLMATTAGRLILGFNVDVHGQLEPHLREQGVEVRLYATIHRLAEDVRRIAAELVPPEPKETVTGQARVIELFKSSRKGVIIGCEVTAGLIEKGKSFRVIGPMGPAYTGRIESLHIAGSEVDQGRVGQQVGIKIPDWKKARIGDLVECFEPPRPAAAARWRPRGGVFRFPP